MGSEFDNWSSDVGAPALADFNGEDAVITLKSGGALPVKAIVYRDQLQTRATDKASRMEYNVEVGIPIADYPTPNIGGDTIAIYVRKGDANTTTKTISSVVSQVAGMWHLRLD